MDAKAKQAEVIKLLNFIYAEWGKEISPALVSFWGVGLAGVPKSLAWEAAKLLVKTKTYGEPKLQNFHEALDKVWPKRTRVNRCGEETTERVSVRELVESTAKLRALPGGRL